MPTGRPSRLRVARVATLLALALPAAPLLAQDTGVAPAASASTTSRLRGIARFGLEHGGDELIEFQYQDGSTPEVTAGGGLHLSLGGAYRAYQARTGGVDAQVALGFKWRTIPPAENQDANWIRFPLDAMLVYRSARGFGVGAGTTVHLANALRASGDVASGRIGFENTPGALLHGEYRFRSATIDVRYTGLRYRFDGDDTGADIDASNIGLGMSWLFGRWRRTR